MTKLHGYGHNRSSLIRVSLLQGLFFLAFGAGIPFFSLYFKHMLTFSNGEPAYHLIGLLFFIQPLFGIVATPLAGLVSDRFKIESRLLCMCSLMVSVGAILISLPGFQNYTHWHLQKRYVFILIGILLNGLFQRPIIPLIDTETLQYLHEAFGSGDRYGQLRMAGSFGWILSTSLFGWILYVSGRLNLAFIGYGAGFMVLALVTSRGFRTKIRPARIQWDHLKNDAVFHRFLIYLFFHSLGLSSSFHFTSYFMDDARAGYFIIGLSFGLSALPEIPIMFYSWVFIQRLGNRWMMMLGSLAQAAKLFLFVIIAHSSRSWLFLPVTLLHGIGFGLHFSGMINFIDRQAHESLRATYQSLLHLFWAMASALSGIFASVILSSLGSGWLMALDGTIILLSSLYFMIWVRGYGPEGLSAGP